jgi:curved DNA-binding protein CbpA
MDYYNLLGVRRGAHAEEIRGAFRRMAKRAHPDAHPHLSGEEKVAMHRQFIQLAHAYETLSDPRLRAAYDRKLSASRADSSTSAKSQRTSARPHSPAGAAPRAKRAAGAKPRRASSRAHSSAGAAPRASAAAGARPRRSRPPPPPPPGDSADLDSLMQDVQELLDKFGLNMRQQFGEMLDKALDWALSVFVEVVAALDTDRVEQEKAARKEPPGQPPPRAASSGAASSTEGRGGDSPSSPPNLDDELAALKQQVRSSGERKRGRAPTPESVEEALQQIKERAKKNP